MFGALEYWRKKAYEARASGHAEGQRPALTFDHVRDLLGMQTPISTETLGVRIWQRGVLQEKRVIVRPSGMQMSFGYMASLVVAIVAVVAVFVEIPIISDYAFWVLVGAYFILHGILKPAKSFRPSVMASLVLLFACDRGALRRHPNNQRLRLLGFGGRLSRPNWRLRHLRLAVVLAGHRSPPLPDFQREVPAMQVIAGADS